MDYWKLSSNKKWEYNLRWRLASLTFIKNLKSKSEINMSKKGICQHRLRAVERATGSAQLEAGEKGPAMSQTPPLSLTGQLVPKHHFLQ